MMEEELRQFLKQHGWNLFTRERRERTYYYAQKWRRGEVYIAPASKIREVTKAHVLEKLANAL